MKRSTRPDGDAVANEIIASAKLHAAAIIEDSYSFASQLCESPIERIFLAQMLHPAVSGEFDSSVTVLMPKSRLVAHASPPPYPGFFVWPQIIIGNYRVDFLVASTHFDRTITLVVECDGHDFHEKTKLQAMRDKARDRYLVAQGYRVVRYSGSEIYRDSYSSVIELFSMLMDLR